MNKKVMIIGGSSGIGLSLVKHFLKNGYTVAATGRDLSNLYPLLENYPNHLFISAFDIRSENATTEIDTLIQALNGVDYYIHCAAIITKNDKPVWRTDQAMINTNVEAFTRCVSHVYNLFQQNGKGHITIISSIAALRGGASSPAYNASKAFQSNYIEGLRLQAAVSKSAIKILDVKPGFVDTRMSANNKTFWVVSLSKACNQIAAAITSNKSTVVISKRWYLPALLMRFLPTGIYTFLTKTFHSQSASA